MICFNSFKIGLLFLAILIVSLVFQVWKLSENEFKHGGIDYIAVDSYAGCEACALDGWCNTIQSKAKPDCLSAFRSDNREIVWKEKVG